MTITGLHHISLIIADAQRTIDFYTGVLGLRLVKKTVNFDDPSTYHLYFGDARGSVGSVVTFFEIPGMPRGRRGIGGTHHLALTVAERDGLLKWKRWLTDQGITVHGPYDRHYFESIYFTDPDGVMLEIATAGPGFAVDEPAERLGQAYQAPPQRLMRANRDSARIAEETWSEPVPTITPDMALKHGMHHITAIGADIHRSDDFYRGVLGLKLIKQTANFDDTSSAHWYWGIGRGEPGTLITYFERDPKNTTRSRDGVGQTHHFAFSVPDDAAQLVWRERLMQAGYSVTPVKDRVYFKSIYTRDPDGHIVEIATAGPGFTVDEAVDQLGTALKLPSWLEAYREQIEHTLKPVTAPKWAKPEVLS